VGTHLDRGWSYLVASYLGRIRSKIGIPRRYGLRGGLGNSKEYPMPLVNLSPQWVWYMADLEILFEISLSLLEGDAGLNHKLRTMHITHKIPALLPDSWKQGYRRAIGSSHESHYIDWGRTDLQGVLSWFLVKRSFPVRWAVELVLGCIWVSIGE